MPSIHDLTPRAAHVVLGPDHRLARAEDRARVLARQAAAVAPVLLGAGAGALAGVAALRAVAVAAALVLAVLAAALLMARAARRSAALDLIADGHGTLPVLAVRRERARLGSPRHARALARSLEGLRDEARRPARLRPVVVPLYVPRVIREADDELGAALEALRRPRPAPRVVAGAERLLTQATSPLYGDDAGRLREALRALIR